MKLCAKLLYILGMSHSLWYTLLCACATAMSYRLPISSQQIVIQTGCFNIYHLCPERNLPQPKNLPSSTPSSAAMTRRLIIRTKYINDLKTMTTSLTTPKAAATTALPSEIIPEMTTGIITTISTTDATTYTTTIIPTTIVHSETTYIAETTLFTTPVTHEEPSSLSPDTTDEKQFTSRREEWTDHKKEDKNPCKYGEPAKGFDQKSLICSSSNSVTCPKGFFCHIGTTQTETVCCERSGLADPCSLPVDEGEGSAQLERYYYDDYSGNCQHFIYHGMKGNENSFLTYEECKRECMRWDLVCEIAPKVSERRSCSESRRECGEEQWCHIGSSTYSSLCCAGTSINPCELSVAEGEGNETITRWFADRNDHSCTRQCKTFTYKGLKGNQNNFLTKEDCEEQCKRKCEDPCGIGAMLLTPRHTPFFCSSLNVCPRNYWCHIGAHTNTTVCCPESGINRCEQPMVEGTGNNSLQRWYFEQTSHKCFTFYYRGKEGNQNSFLTEDDCNRACAAYDNPCGDREPFLIDGKPKICSSEERCPAAYYCHIGADGTQNFCCRKNGNPCDQSVDQGEGESLLLRYYYDKDSRRCREFAYLGSRGNANNFLSEEECEITCPAVPNPCAYGRPLRNAQNEPIICGGSESCPSDYYCHIGGSPETTNCCPGSNDTCKLPLKVGKGTEQLQRWYFDRKQQMCRQFIYRGLHGNANNFITRESCQQNCQEMNPCGSGIPLTDQRGRQIFCKSSGSDECPHDYFCHKGSSPLTMQCCPRQGKLSLQNKSNVKFKLNFFFGMFGIVLFLKSKQIIYFESEMESFVYLIRMEGKNPCEQSLSIGYGGEKISRWFYDASSKKCLKFVYSGLGGNENNFLSRKSCEESCREREDYCPHGDPLMGVSGKTLVKCGVDNACPLGFICNINVEKNITACCQDPANFCLQPMDAGQKCKDFEMRYGYDPELDDCVYYQYGGCGGTLNNFKTLEKCTEVCCKND
uniref:Kunitz/Bovine pancreatic trypsin inhibitor domain protein n=1 Tax=Elaeophora elaphi TaxID=1147741 RepID=A0A0R3RG30_9BILA